MEILERWLRTVGPVEVVCHRSFNSDDPADHNEYFTLRATQMVAGGFIQPLVIALPMQGGIEVAFGGDWARAHPLPGC